MTWRSSVVQFHQKAPIAHHLNPKGYRPDGAEIVGISEPTWAKHFMPL